MNKQAPNTHDVRGLGRAEHGILQQRSPKSLSLPVTVDREPAEDRHGDRVGHVAAQRSGSVCSRECTRGETIVADDAIDLADDIRPGCPAELIDAGAATQPVVQARIAAVEHGEIMPLGEQRRCTEGQDCHGLLAFISRSKPSPLGGRSRTERKCS